MQLSLAPCSCVGALVASFTQNVWRLPSTNSQMDLSSCEKYLDKFFKICHTGFWPLVCDSIQSRKSHVLHNKGLFQDSFQKLFIFPSHHVTIHRLVRLSLYKITMFTHKTSIFVFISSAIFKKQYGSCLFLNVFHVTRPRFLRLGVFDEI